MYNNVYVRYFYWFLYLKIFLVFPTVQPVCNDTVCGGNGTCQNSELQSNGYICQCNSSAIFDGITCVRMYHVSLTNGIQYKIFFFFYLIERKFCDNSSSSSNGTLPCSDAFQLGVDLGEGCSCSCRGSSSNITSNCPGKLLQINKIINKNICFIE
jgi:hypothetical protein